MPQQACQRLILLSIITIVAVIQYKDFKQLRNKLRGKKLVFCSGTFDITHAGHVLFFEDCKALGDLLVVGIGNDEACKRHKGSGSGRPVLNEYLRLKMVSSLKPVDYCFLHGTSSEKQPHNSLLEEIFTRLKPDIYAFNSDVADVDYRKKLAEKYKVEVRVLERKSPPEFEEISTTKIIEKVQKIRL